MIQTLIVGLIVAAAFAYSAWALMPAAWQRALRRRLGLAVPADAGGCGGCGGGCAAPPKAMPGTPAVPGQAVITLHRRLPASGRAAGNQASGYTASR